MEANGISYVENSYLMSTLDLSLFSQTAVRFLFFFFVSRCFNKEQDAEITNNFLVVR